jgi:hypothetical protein
MIFGPGSTLTITPSTYWCQTTHRQLGDQVMRAHALDPRLVALIELSEADAIVWSFTHSHEVVRWAEHGGCFVQVRRRYPLGGAA